MFNIWKWQQLNENTVKYYNSLRQCVEVLNKKSKKLSYAKVIGVTI